MNLKGLDPGARLVTMSGDIVELIAVAADGQSAQVCYLEVLPGSDATPQTEVTLPAEEIATVDGTRFVGPPRTSSSSR